ncbi:hypothetical protein MACH24_09240 [Erythrobacter sp. Dej080120_24]|uniref:serine hydrolase domain-containing protein n=1 Tax=Erythrobacter sp. Dej080120_24 TaxID=3024837 RepID=UPI002926D27A|nr:hypothetical protein MACH24_09240 [Erythrobacter sp. Dej080120_24]
MPKIFAVLCFCLALVAQSTAAQPWPEHVTDPDKAVSDWRYNDPVFFWRLISAPDNPYEPPEWFYWPDAVIEGDLKPFVPQADARDRTISDAALEDMASWAQARNSNVLIVVHRGKIQIERYWNGTEPDDLLNGRAITRSVTPMVLGFALEQGALALDDPIGKYLTEWKTDLRGQITVRQLAQHVSGLEVAVPIGVEQIENNKDLCLAYCGDVVKAALDYDYVTASGTKFEVAQENMQLLSIVIERATGVPIEQFVSRHIWKPMGAGNATFQRDRPGGTARTMCCMRATARDWTRLGILVANEGKWGDEQVVPAEWLATMATPSARNPNFGLGLWLGSPFNPLRTYFEDQPGVIPQSEPFLADDVRIMEGGGFRVVYSVPSLDLVIFRHGPTSDGWDSAYLVNTVMRDLAK